MTSLVFKLVITLCLSSVCTLRSNENLSGFNQQTVRPVLLYQDRHMISSTMIKVINNNSIYYVFNYKT